jgi:superfamily I DNA/RNA helicase
MTKKHFEAFARIIRDATPHAGPEESNLYDVATRHAMAYLVIAVAERDNLRFDRSRFLLACGLDVAS